MAPNYSRYDSGKKEQYDLSLDKEQVTISPRKETNKYIGRSSWYYLGFFGQLGISIALPIAGGAIIGSFVDAHWGTRPTATLIGLGIGFVISIMQFINTVRSIIKQ